MSNPLLFVVVVTNAGGEGKTLITHLLQAIFKLAGLNPAVLDADAGNAAARSFDQNAWWMGWGVQTEVAAQIVDKATNRILILDAGANMLASAREITDLIPALSQEFAARGYKNFAIMPVSTNKLGAGQSLKRLAPKLSGFQKVFVKVDRDGSRNFEVEFEATDQVVELGHLDPGFQEYYRHVGDLAESVSSPPSEFSLASQFVAKWLCDFARQPAIAEMIGIVALNEVLKFEPKDLPTLHFMLLALEEVKEANFKATIHRSNILSMLDKHGWDAAGLRRSADLLR